MFGLLASGPQLSLQLILLYVLPWISIDKPFNNPCNILLFDILLIKMERERLRFFAGYAYKSECDSSINKEFSTEKIFQNFPWRYNMYKLTKLIVSLRLVN